MHVLVTGATGFVGSRLSIALASGGAEVRCMVRDRSRAASLRRAGCEVVEGDVGDPESLAGVAEGVQVAYYLIHSMAAGGDFERREREGARRFAKIARQEGVSRIVYLGGLGDPGVSKHLRSRHETALALAAEGPPLTYFRAAMIVGSRSESYRTLRYLAARLPVMIAPAWLQIDTQPIGIDDAVEYLRRAPEVAESQGREVQIGGPDVLSYGEMLDEMAAVLGRRAPLKIPVPLISPRLSALWLGLVTPVNTRIARPLVEGLRTATVVTDPSGAQPFRIRPLPFRQTLERALAEERAADSP